MDFECTQNQPPENGAVLITLVGDNAIWVFIDNRTQMWPEMQTLVDDIFLRVAVIP